MTHGKESSFIGGNGKTKHEPDLENPYTQYQSWLAETSGMIGCPVNCQYCFFQVDGLTPARPERGIPPRELVEKLEKQQTFSAHMPLHFGSKTDAFATAVTTTYYTEALHWYTQSANRNPLVLITKKRIPDEVLEIAHNARQPILFYVSFSGLGGTPIEPLVDNQVLKENLVRLRERGLIGIHYWRPFVPQNSSREQLHAMLEFVSRYATCSVLNGLRLSTGIRNHMMRFWPELSRFSTEEIEVSGEFWPEGVRAYLMEYVRRAHPRYPVFFGNTPCSIAHSLKVPDLCGHFNEAVCIESNCPQRLLCESSHEEPSSERVKEAVEAVGIPVRAVEMRKGELKIRGAIPSSLITHLRFTLKSPVISDSIDYKDGYNWANVREVKRIVEVPW